MTLLFSRIEIGLPELFYGALAKKDTTVPAPLMDVANTQKLFFWPLGVANCRERL